MSEPTLPICQHIKINGARCQVQAMQNRPYCHFHDETEKRRRVSARLTRRLANRDRRSINIPVLEDANAIQLALMETINALIDQRLDHKDAGLLFYALQTASANVKSLQLNEAAPRWSFYDELTERARKLNEEIHDFNKWQDRQRKQIREELEQEIQTKREEMKKPPASELPAAAATQ